MTVEIKSQVPDSYKYGWYDKEAPINVKHKGLSPEVVREISQTCASTGIIWATNFLHEERQALLTR